MNQQIHSNPDVPIAENVETITRDTGFYAEILTRAHQDGLCEVQTTLSQIPTEGNERTAIVKAEVRTSKGLFHAYGDASPESVDTDYLPHLIRVAETRAKARALRDAVNMGAATFEGSNGESSTMKTGAAEAEPPSVSANDTPPLPETAGRTETGPAPEGFISLSEAQRRYLYRLVAAHGFKGEAADARILELFGASAFSEISKSAAREKIDRLLREESNPAPTV